MELLDLVLAQASGDIGEAAIDLRIELASAPVVERASARRWRCSPGA